MLFEVPRSAFGSWNQDSDHIYYSPTLKTQLGYPPHAPWERYEDLESRLHPCDREAVIDQIRTCLESGDTAYSSTFRLRNSDGSYRWILSLGKHGRDDDGRRRMIGVHIDVHQRVADEEELRRLNRDLQDTNCALRKTAADLEESADQLAKANAHLARTNAELDRFTSVASHDLQEPLRQLVSFCGLLPRDLGTELPESAAKDLHYIVDAATRMRTLVRDPLDYSKAGESALEANRVCLDDCVDQALAALRQRIDDTGARIHRDPLPEVTGNATLLTQVYQNLIGNALKFVGPDQTPVVHLTCAAIGDQVVLGVRDNGIGFDSKHAEQIFQPFRRMHQRTSYDGNGISLAVCQRVVERHDSRIWVESRLGHGSHFRFSIPAPKLSAAPSPLSTLADGSTG